MAKRSTERGKGGLWKRWPGEVCAWMLRVGRAALSGTVGVGALRLLIVGELCLLGTGVVRRLEDSYELAAQAAQMQFAIVDAQNMALSMQQRSAVGIGAVGDDEETDAPDDTAPELRARDVPTIISDVLGDVEVAVDMMSGGAAAAPTAQEGQEPQEPAADAADSETREEVDALIRRGVAAMTAGDMRRCVLSLEQANALAPNHPAMLYYYGLAYDKLLNPTKAKEYYDRLFRMRDRAGKYFQRASRRLAYGMEQPTAMRGKLSFGPYKVQHTQDDTRGEKVSILLPILLAPGEEIRSDDVYIRVQIFELVNGRKVDFSREQPKYKWVNERQTWENWEEELIVTYDAPAPTADELSTAGDVRYYGFTAVLAYKGEPLDLISTPSALILHEQQLNNPRRGGGTPGLLPDDGLSPDAEDAVPFSDQFDEPPMTYQP